MIKCYEYLGCKKMNCPAYPGEDEVSCWEIDDTLCNIPEVQKLIKAKGNKLEFCKVCIYYKHKKEF